MEFHLEVKKHTTINAKDKAPLFRVNLKSDKNSLEDIWVKIESVRNILFTQFPEDAKITLTSKNLQKTLDQKKDAAAPSSAE